MAAGATYEPIATTTLTSAASTITFSSISGSYTDLRVVLVGQSADSVSDTYLAAVRFNSDTGTNYSRTYIIGDGTSTASGSAVDNTYCRIGSLPNSTQWGLATMDVFSYAGSTYKTLLSQTNSNNNTTANSVIVNVGLWRSTSAITTISLFLLNTNLNTGSVATLYGITKA